MTANVVPGPWIATATTAALRLKIFRQQERLTIKQLSQATGIDATALARYVRAERAIPEDALERLARYFECSLAEIRGEG